MTTTREQCKFSEDANGHYSKWHRQLKPMPRIPLTQGFNLIST